MPTWSSERRRTSIDPPKGSFTFVNRCSLTGVWLGPPNYHEYQSRLVRHHQQRLRHIPFDEFKSRIQTVKDPEAVKAWVESMSVKSEYECILDAEPTAFATRDELERHFVEAHLAQFITSAPEVRISGTASRQLQNPALLETVRLAWMQERKFPLKTANEMRGKLRHEGFHFFKDPKGVTYIGRVKPQRFESISHLTDQIQKIIVYLRDHFGCTRKQLIAQFVPRPAPSTPAAAPVPDSAAPPPAPVQAEAQAPASAPVHTRRPGRGVHVRLGTGHTYHFGATGAVGRRPRAGRLALVDSRRLRRGILQRPALGPCGQTASTTAGPNSASGSGGSGSRECDRYHSPSLGGAGRRTDSVPRACSGRR